MSGLREPIPNGRNGKPSRRAAKPNRRVRKLHRHVRKPNNCGGNWNRGVGKLQTCVGTVIDAPNPRPSAERRKNGLAWKRRFWNKGQRIELENGQVWEITNETNLFHKTTNPRVTIEKGLFSSFYLHIEGVSKSLKVQRIR
jgi:hypothetical protein